MGWVRLVSKGMVCMDLMGHRACFHAMSLYNSVTPRSQVPVNLIHSTSYNEIVEILVTGKAMLLVLVLKSCSTYAGNGGM